MDFFGIILWPIKWVIELVLVAFHWFWTNVFSMAPGDGWTWILSLAGLVIVVRSLMIPLMVRQIKSQRSMLEAAPEIKKIQDKYKGKRDQFSMEAMRRETMEVYQRTGSNPMSSCWPMLVQMPIFFALFQVIQSAQNNHAGVGMMSQEHASEFANASVFDAPLAATFLNNGGNVTVIVIAIVLVIVMTGSQFFMQKQIMSKNISPATRESPMFRQQQMLLYILPLVFAVSGVAFPLGLMIYWTISNFWTIGQQWIVIRQMPTPGSEAAKAREERLRRRGKWVDPEPAPGKGGKGVIGKRGASAEPEEEEPTTPTSSQRQQPMSKSRAKKQQARGGAAAAGAASEGSNAAGGSDDTAPAAASGANTDGDDDGVEASNADGTDSSDQGSSSDGSSGSSPSSGGAGRGSGGRGSSKKRPGGGRR